MKILNIVHEPNPVLRKVAEAIDFSDWEREDLKKLAIDMVATMKAAPGVGLAAPQIGKSIRLIVVDHTPTPIVMINPEITKRSVAADLLEEGCLSVPEKYGVIKRQRNITVEGLDLDGKELVVEAKGYLAEIFQHEVDHLNGVLYIDRVEKMLE
jgi:peptide deformylase